MSAVHLAQVNIARLRAPLDSPLLADFVAGLAPINALAEASPGFIWRLKDEAGDATQIPYSGDPAIIVNLSVWESVEALREFTYRTRHTDFLKRRREWFTRLDFAVALQWTVPGEFPTPAQARAKLALLEAMGPCAEVFTFGQVFGAPVLDAKQ